MMEGLMMEGFNVCWRSRSWVGSGDLMHGRPIESIDRSNLNSRSPDLSSFNLALMHARLILNSPRTNSDHWTHAVQSYSPFIYTSPGLVYIDGLGLHGLMDLDSTGLELGQRRLNLNWTCKCVFRVETNNFGHPHNEILNTPQWTWGFDLTGRLGVKYGSSELGHCCGWWTLNITSLIHALYQIEHRCI